MRGRTCVCGGAWDDKAIRNELDWLLSMGLMWATDLKTGLKGIVLLLLVFSVVYCMPHVWRCLVDTVPKLQHVTQR